MSTAYTAKRRLFAGNSVEHMIIIIIVIIFCFAEIHEFFAFPGNCRLYLPPGESVFFMIVRGFLASVAPHGEIRCRRRRRHSGRSVGRSVVLVAAAGLVCTKHISHLWRHRVWSSDADEGNNNNNDNNNIIHNAITI